MRKLIVMAVIGYVWKRYMAKTTGSPTAAS